MKNRRSNRIKKCLNAAFENSKGLTLIEVILVIVVLSIAVTSLLELMSSILVYSNDSVILTQAMMYAQEKMEEIIADKKNPNRGYDWIITPGNYENDTPAQGFTRSVSIETSNKVYNGVPYALVEVSVAHEDLPVVKLTTWLTDY